LQCVEDGRDHALACIQCEKDGITAEECGPKTLPKNRSTTTKRKTPNEELQQKVIVLEEKVDKMERLLIGPPSDRMYWPYNAPQLTDI